MRLKRVTAIGIIWLAALTGCAPKNEPPSSPCAVGYGILMGHRIDQAGRSCRLLPPDTSPPTPSTNGRRAPAAIDGLSGLPGPGALLLPVQEVRTS